VIFSASPLERMGAHPPGRAVPEHDASVMRMLFRGARFPDTEWWWNTIHVEVADESGHRRNLSIITNVQLMGEPLRGELRPAAVVAIRDVFTGERWVRTSRGVLSNDEACRYTTPGWTLMRLDPSRRAFDEDAFSVGIEPDDARRRFPKGAYVVQVETETFEVDLLLAQTKWGLLGPKGWLDYNERGRLPLWATTKTRMADPRGTIHLSTRGHWRSYEVVGGSAHFEQQCVLPSASLPVLALVALDPRDAERALTELRTIRPKWHWYRASLGRGVHFTGFVMWSMRTGAPMRKLGALFDPFGHVVAVDPRTLRVEPYDHYSVGDVTVPRATRIRFDLPARAHHAPVGEYELDLRHAPDIDWRVPYQCPMGLVCMAHEAHAVVETAVDGRSWDASGVATQETIDLEASLLPDGGS
jgi:hypothetical protein